MAINRFQRHPVIGWSLVVVLAVFVSESAAYLFFAARPLVQKILSAADEKEFHAILARDGVSHNLLERESKALYFDRVRFHPYRWYALPANYRGVYVTTDGYGFRIDPFRVSPRTNKIAFFGGSTMFSARSGNEWSIPALFNEALDGRVAQALNFGVGGYSSAAELTTFIEALRAYDRITCAIFYDGYNEIVRYVERLQDHAAEPYYDVLGYHYYSALGPAMESVIDAHEIRIIYTSQTIRLIAGVVQRLRGTRNINVIVSDADVPRHAEALAAIYIRNIRDIAAIAQQHNVTAVFFWHPDIGSTTKKRFTDRELKLKASDPVVRKLSAAVRAILPRKPELIAHHWFDLSKTLDGLDDRPHFLDPVHVSVDANRLIARRIVDSLHGIVPGAYWK